MSVFEMIENNFHAGEVCREHLWIDLLKHEKEHLKRMNLFSGHFDNGFHRFIESSFKTFTFLRDPIERYLSEFSFIKENMNLNEREGIEYSAYREKDLDDFLSDKSLKDFTCNTMCKCLGSEVLFPMSVVSTEEEIIQKACDNLQSLLIVGILEHFFPSLDLLSYKLGWMPEKRILKTNATINRIQSGKISEKNLTILNSILEGDSRLYKEGLKLHNKQVCEMLGELSNSATTSVKRKLLSIVKDDSTYDATLYNKHQKLIHKAINRHSTKNIKKKEFYSSCDYTFDQPLSCSGFYPREELKGNYLPWGAWTGRMEAAYFQISLLNDTDKTVSISISNWIEKTQVDNTKLFINELIELPLANKTFRVNPNGRFMILSFSLKKSLISKFPHFTEFKITWGESVSPASINTNSKDIRKLGICINLIHIS